MSLEQSDKEAGEVATAPRVTLAALEAKVRSETYHTHGVLTICILQMVNGFYITGESAPADVANYNEHVGKKFAREQAIRKAWGFEGYLLREKLHSGA